MSVLKTHKYRDNKFSRQKVILDIQGWDYAMCGHLFTEWTWVPYICVVYTSCVVTERINLTDAFWVEWVCPLRAEDALTNSNIHLTCRPPVHHQGHLRVWTKPWAAFSLQGIINHWVWISVLLKGVGVWLSMLNQVWAFDWLKNLGSTHRVRHWARPSSH